MHRFLVGLSVVLRIGTAAWVPPSLAGRVTANTPPPGLTGYGRNVWNLDALLHDTFGQRTVWLDFRSSWPHTPASFSTTFIDFAHTRIFLYTFADARGSMFRAKRPARPPRPKIGISGFDVPLTIRGAYIACTSKTWLYEHGGEAFANWRLACLPASD